MQNQDAAIRNLETHIGQIAKLVSERPLGTLLCNDGYPRKELQEVRGYGT